MTARHQIDVVVASMRFGDGVTYDALQCAATLRLAGLGGRLWCDRAMSAPEARQWAEDYRGLIDARPRPDAVLYCYSTLSDITLFLRQHRIPILLRYQNITPPHFFESFAPDQARRLKRAREELATLAETTVAGMCPSRFNAEELEALGMKTSAPVPNFCRLSAPRSTLPPERLVRLLFVGRLVPNKAQHELVRVASLLREEFGRPVELVLAGNLGDCPTYAQLVRSLAERSPAQVRLIGEFPEGYDIFEHANLYLSLSRHEGFGMPLVEAMSAGVPVVARAAGAVVETVGAGGIVFEAETPRAIAALVEGICAQPERWKALREAACQRAQAFSHDRIRQQLLEALASYGFEGDRNVSLSQ